VAPRLIAIVGPTAAGKSELALQLACDHGAEIVSCDSLQVYRGLDVGSAKPSAEERLRVPHHMIDVRDPDEPFSAADYAGLARASLAEIAARGRPALVVGGTGLYLRALLHGLFEGPSRDEALRDRLAALAERFGDARLHRLLARVDPEAARRIQPRDRLRVVRALEVYRATRRPLSEHHREGEHAALSGFAVQTLGLAPAREALRGRVERRTDAMLAAGLLDETRGLLERYPAAPRPLRAIGYRQAAAVLRGEQTLVAARHDIVAATMKYAKRQLTWFRHQSRADWHATPEAARAAADAWLAREAD
jgi:tRNA dimethylallyltransferase